MAPGVTDISPGPDRLTSPQRSPSLRICLATSELAGPDYNGGIGTAVRGLALALTRAGHRVEILYTRVERGTPFCFRGGFDDQVEAYRRIGIVLRALPHAGEWNDWLAKSHLVMQDLRAARFDHVVFNDMHGSGYYAQVARRTADPALAGTTMTVVLHSPTQWISELNKVPLTSLEDIRLVEMERRSIELADAVLSPSHYMLDKCRGYGWSLPADATVIPNLLPDRRPLRPAAPRLVRVEEIVFFGRLERRKGLWLFCEAIDRIKHEIGDVAVTFLGKLTEEDGELTGFPILERASAWPFDVQILHDFDREQALGYLNAGRRLAVMPAQEDNSPCAILECLSEGIPFIASSGSGGQELIAEPGREQVLFPPTVEALARRLRSILSEGASTGLPASDPVRNEAAVMAWVERTAGRASGVGARPAPAAEPAPPGWHLVVVAPPHLPPAGVVANLVRGAAAAERPATILTEDPAAFLEQLPAPLPAGVTVAEAQDFGRVARALAQEPRLIGLCHASQVLPPEWLARAGRGLQGTPGIGALTGLAGGPGVEPAPSGPGPAGRRVGAFRIGWSRAMFALAPDSNCGFVALRPELLGLVADLGPTDPQYGQFKRMQDWVHEIVLRLDQHGHAGEMLPDLVVDDRLDERPSPVFRLGRIARTLVGPAGGYAPGSEQALLARLAVETALRPEQALATHQGLDGLRDTFGGRSERADLWATADGTVRTLVAMAHAAGQTELAHELATERLLPRAEVTDGPRPLAAALRRRRQEIALFDLAAAGAFTGFNLSHEWSLRLLPDQRELELHPNAGHEGRATVVFRDLDLGDLTVLRGGIRVACPQGRPVRYRVDIVTPDGANRIGVERVVRPDEALRLEAPLPGEVRTRCHVSLSTEMADPSDPAEGAWARWTDLRLSPW